jgi:tetratricopeptide (TPR) repeat protein
MNSLSIKHKCSALFIGCLLTFPLMASAQSSSAGQAADALYQAQKWSEAAEAYRLVTKADPANARAWHRLGASLHALSKYSEAVTAFQKAIEIGRNPQSMYGLARSYAKLNDKDKGFEWLTKALNAGLSQSATLNVDPDLASLREDTARFQELLKLADRLANPCMFQAEHRQFDFWVGEWTVQNAQGQQVGTSSIQRIENGCVILENWTAGPNATGKSINFYDATLKKWRQTWADSVGGVSEFAGEFKDGAMRYEGESHAPTGAKILRRLTFFNLNADRVRQFSEASTDAGKTWSVNYDFTYLRKHVATFDVLPVPDQIRNYKWIKLMEDKQGDGRLKQSADGKALHYFYDPASDLLWFKLDLYSKVNLDVPAVSISIDTDADQSTGIAWYGSNSKFKFDKMLSVGPTGKQDGR